MDRTNTLNSPAGAAPSAPQPGYGRGNVPFAPGIMSGNLGQQTNPQQLARATAPQRQMAQPGMPPSAAPPGQGTPPGGPPGMGGMAGPVINPQVMIEFLNAYMNALMQAVQKQDTNFGLY
jgi:hypothetical protein